MKIYNTLTNQKEEFKPLEDGKIKMYLCGPTVYNYIHIGNARPFVIFDAVRRYFEYKNYKVDFVQNFTDVDDKIIKRSLEENSSMETVSNKYIDEFFVDVDKLNIKRATHYPRVTQEMPGIIEMISTLINKGFAYEKNGSVYFSTKSFDGYGKLSNRKLDDMEAGARIAINEEKNDPMDFVLWKPAKENEPFWESPWGNGRPGWHIECSVMSKKYLGEQIDIHAGGEDLIFPHHENEIAQSEAANGKDFSKYWLHNSMVTVDNRKMSKSEGNFFTVRDIVKKYSYDTIRFFILNGHYRMSLSFGDDLLLSAQSALDKIRNRYSELIYIVDNSIITDISEDEKVLLPRLDDFEKDFMDSMDDDFNTPNAITSIFELVNFANQNTNGNSCKAFAKAIMDRMDKLCDILGIKLVVDQQDVDTAFIESKLADRKKAREDKNFALSDQIRDELLEIGVTIKDTREGVKWFYSGTMTGIGKQQ